MKRLLITIGTVMLLLGGWADGRAAPAKRRTAPVVLKFATIMPRGGPWANAMSRLAVRVKKKTQGEVVFKFYYGAVAGTEQRAVGRLKANQIQGLAAAAAALSSIDSSIRVLELPRLYRSYKEFRFVIRSMEPIFRKRFKRRGYRLLAMASAGWIYLYTKKPVRSLSDLHRCKAWHWKGDPMATMMFKVLGMHTQTLPITDVLASLQARVIDTVYGMPHATQALQWHTSVKYALDYRISMAVASVLIRDDAFTKLTPAQQKIVQYQGQIMQRFLNRISASMNAKAMRSMQRHGLKLIKPSAAFLKQLQPLKIKLRQSLGKTMYKPADLKKIKALLTLCRATSCSSK